MKPRGMAAEGLTQALERQPQVRNKLGLKTFWGRGRIGKSKFEQIMMFFGEVMLFSREHDKTTTNIFILFKQNKQLNFSTRNNDLSARTNE